jgi:photosystem II stability/assembly factor-like uncharacterized protein
LGAVRRLLIPLLLAFGLRPQAPLRAQWTQRPQFHTTNDLLDLRVDGAGRGVCVGEGNVLLCTTDGGTVWSGTGSADPDLVSADLADGVFWFGNDRGALFRETNPFTCDNDPVAPAVPALDGLTDWVALDADRGWIAASGRVWYSDNGWTSLTAVANLGCPMQARALYAASDTLAFAAGADGRVHRIRRLGGTFVCQTALAGGEPLLALHGRDSRLAAAGADGTVWISEDGGAGWTAAGPPGAPDLRAVHVGPEAVFAGGGGSVYRLDGETWTRQPLPGLAGTVRALWFADANRGWACGDNGYLAATDNGGGPGLPLGLAPAAAAWRVGPVPFRDRLHLDGPRPGARLALFDAAGRAVAHGAVDAQGGWDVPPLPAGAYVLWVEAFGRRPVLRAP